MNKRIQLKPAPVDGAMLIIPDQILSFFGWKVGMYLRIEVDQDGRVVLSRFHLREEERC